VSGCCLITSTVCSCCSMVLGCKSSRGHSTQQAVWVTVQAAWICSVCGCCSMVFGCQRGRRGTGHSLEDRASTFQHRSVHAHWWEERDVLHAPHLSICASLLRVSTWLLCCLPSPSRHADAADVSR
jgi:hypothetical protein